MQQLADSMLVAAGTVLGRLVEQPAAPTASKRHDHEGSIRTDGDELVTLAEIPSIGAKVVVRFPSTDMQSVVGIMLGGAEGLGEMGPMQLSIASETVSQIAVAMAEALAKDLKVTPDGIRAELCTDATALPPPPFESYEATISVGSDLAPHISIDFAAITMSKMGETVGEHAPAAAASIAEPVAAAPKPAPERKKTPAGPPPNAQSVAYTPMQPTQVRAAQPGQANLDLVHDVPLQISAVLGKSVMPLREVVSLQSGTVFELDKLAADPIDLYVNNILIARGEVVVVDDKYAVKISELNPQAG
ncbi:MAG: flagellar motor switch protein FliN [Candidatus Eremiobacteraeota bacterium]|nr:flagellar motor switch protein FliN [Candidatus Eremiobacteraeota bacterium]